MFGSSDLLTSKQPRRQERCAPIPHKDICLKRLENLCTIVHYTNVIGSRSLSLLWCRADERPLRSFYAITTFLIIVLDEVQREEEFHLRKCENFWLFVDQVDRKATPIEKYVFSFCKIMELFYNPLRQLQCRFGNGSERVKCTNAPMNSFRLICLGRSNEGYYPF